MMAARADRRFTTVMIGGAAILLAAYLSIWWLAPLAAGLLQQLWFLPGVGLLGAIIANTSGTGGGVVFVPVFSVLRSTGTMALDPAQVVAASFLIQCFGMSMGALRWSIGLHRESAETRTVALRDYWRVIGVVLALALPAMLLAQHFARFNPHHVLLAFKCFSVVLGLVVILTTWTINKHRPPLPALHRADLIVLAFIGLLGGFITALFSVGVGELVALYLFIRHYPVALCTGAAVTISAVSVLVGAPFHIIGGHVVWEVVVLAAPGAVLGGYLARPAALWLGANRLKTLDGCWIVGSSLYLIALNIR